MNMTYDEALAYWYSHINYEQRSPSWGDLKLDRMRNLLNRLDDPHRYQRIVHVTGSKGKGSVSAMIATILRRAGYRTGLFTSPHLSKLEERFQVDGVAITRDELTQVILDVKTAIESHSPFGVGGARPTFFEICTAVGLLHYRRRATTATVLEVGLGGRLDSTNVCRPVLSVITSISYDHTKILGTELSSIAREKAGIIKVGRPVVSGVTQPEPKTVIVDIARNRTATLVGLGDDFHYEYQPGFVDRQLPQVRVTTRQRRWPWLEIGLLGEHQAANAAVVVACVEELRRQGWSLPDDAVASGLRDVNWPARMEVVRRNPYVVLDCAHNAASAEFVVRTLESTFPPGPRTLIFAASSDKDVVGMFKYLRPAFSRVIFTRYTTNPRAIPPAELVELWGGGEAVEPPAEAVRVALEGEKLVCITGSLFLAGELRPLLVEVGETDLSHSM
ncbi:MAG: bifunctional folylpolyglutamate synthase/dihydrofolate synthase [Planctomycetia bacterium]|nr:bifunctional folylpolyglutamate synthase/dihydrofolate synthase [Planctomycetia bacterium]